MGPEFGIALSNWEIVTFDATAAVIDRQGFADFFETLLGFSVFGDAVARYDSDSDRFFIIVQDTDENEIGLAVSTTSSPALDSESDWHAYAWDISPSLQLHYHNIEIGDDYIYISALVLHDSDRPIIGYAPKAGLLSGTQTTLTWGQLSAWQQGQTMHVNCVKDYDRDSDVGRFLSFSRVEDQSEIRLYAVDPPSTSVTTYDLTVSDYLPAPSLVDTPDAEHDFDCHPNTMNSVLRNGHLWTTHCIGVYGSETEREAHVRWYEIDLDGWPAQGSSPSVLQTGTIDPPGSGVSAIYPAIHVDDDGNMAIAWMQCSSTQYISIYRAIHRHDDASGTLREPLLLHAGGPQTSGTVGLTADYTMMDEDPNQPGVMWAHHMFFGLDASQEPEGQSWLGLIDVNRSLTLELEDTMNDPPKRGDEIKLTSHGSEPNTTVKWFYSLTGCGGQTYIPSLAVALDMSYAILIGQSTSDSTGKAEKYFTVPNDFPFGPVWLQAAEFENTSEVIETEVVE